MHHLCTQDFLLTCLSRTSSLLRSRVSAPVISMYNLSINLIHNSLATHLNKNKLDLGFPSNKFIKRRTARINRGTQREYSSKPLKHSIVKCILRPVYTSEEIGTARIKRRTVAEGSIGGYGPLSERNR